LKTKETKPLISIALATYNGDKYLTQQIETLLNQTYQNIEIVASDDGSTDDTITILESFEKQHNNFFVYKNKTLHGIKKNFENALRYCNGMYIAFADQDDIWMLNKIEKLFDSIGTNALSYHNSLFVDKDGNSLEKTFSTELNMYEGNDCRAFLLCNCISGHAMLFHRRLLDLALPFPHASHHDWWLAFIAAERGGIKYVDEVLVQYRQHIQSETDFFRLKNEKIDRQQIEKENVDWFDCCATAKGKYKPFLKEWARVNKNKDKHIFNWKMFFMSISILNILYFMQKKSTKSKFFLVLTNSWGKGIKVFVKNLKKKKTYNFM
jgi:glycosyltransferase involved in cell wall biosynthesis